MISHARFLRASSACLLGLLAAASAAAVTPDCAGHILLDPGGLRPDVLPGIVPERPARNDTVWFGGDDGSGVAAAGGVWDFESPGSNGFQGWRSFDMTLNPGTYFGWVSIDSFTAHGDPCAPMLGPGPNTGQIWCGIHEDEADRRDFLGGMGYQNSMCQRAFSPQLAIDPVTQAIDLDFRYFNYTEPAWDYTYIEVLCYDAAGELIDTVPLDVLTGVSGSHAAPAQYGTAGPELPAGTLDAGTATVRIEFRMESDGAWSDEDGMWNTPCGPFAADDIAVTVGATVYAHDFEDGPQGWGFERCAGHGTHMAVHQEADWYEWIDEAGVACDCGLSGGALGLVDAQHSQYSPPGLVPGQKEQACSAPVPHAGYDPVFWNSTCASYDAFANYPSSSGGHYRPGWRVYPYTTEQNPTPHWSARCGQLTWYYTSSPNCARRLDNLSAMESAPLPAAWDSMQYVYEVWCSCDAFSIPSATCVEEGSTSGAPLLDHVRVGLTHAADAPSISLMSGGAFSDGFGQEYPTWLEPSDRGNSDVSIWVTGGGTGGNVCLGDTSVVSGPTVSSEAGRFLVEFRFKVARKGALQDEAPEYAAWKARLQGDPEQEFVAVLMDSLETNHNTQVWRNKFATYFHELDFGFDPGSPDFSPAQEILPDGVFTPGTRVEYYFASFWYNGGAPPSDFFILPPREFEILPTMTAIPGDDFDVQWPCVLYIDAYNGGGAERTIGAVLAGLGLSYDRYDYLNSASCFNAPMKRSHGGSTGCNAGGYGNNGFTTEQMLGYRLVILSTGSIGVGNMQREDFDLFREWVANTGCGLPYLRRGLIFDGDGIIENMADPTQGYAIDFAHEQLGVELVGDSYRESNQDEAYCVYLEPAGNAVFSPAGPGLAAFGNGCPQEFDFNVLGVHPGVAGALGNLRYHSYGGSGNQTYVDFAQVVRQRIEPGVINLMTVANGVSLHHLSERGCAGADCSHDSACVVAGALELYGPLLDWMQDPGDPFEPWRYPCGGLTGVEPPTTHLGGPVDFLYEARPSPFRAGAAIRFSLAQAGEAGLCVFDVSGRRVRTLVDGPLEAGEHAITWDGADDSGRRLGSGIYWVQLVTESGYTSGRRLLRLR